jgi:hypothetical protein
MPVKMSADRLERVRTARNRLVEIVRRAGCRAVNGWVSADENGFNIMHRTPFTAPMPQGSQAPTYLHALLKQRAKPDLPYTMEVWYLNKKILNVQWDDKDEIQLISFRPGEWEEKLAALVDGFR